MAAGKIQLVTTGKSNKSFNRRAYTLGYIKNRKKRGMRKAKLFRAPRAGGASMVIPLKCGYQYTVTGDGSAKVNIDQEVGLQYMVNPDWFNRYHPMFQWIRINKVRIEVVSPYNLGQQGVGGQSLYRIWSKKAGSVAEVPPGSINEWMNLQTTKRKTFSGQNNSINYYYTPAFEAPQGATTAKRLMYKQWFEFPSGPTGAIPHIGLIAQVHKVDGSVISNTEHFNVNVTLYCQCKGIKQL